MSSPVRNDNAFTRVLEAIATTTGHHTRGDGRQRSARCPAHDDTNPSLSITRGNDRVLLKCHHGCDVDQILDAIGLTRADLFDEPHRNGQNGQRNSIVATYDYHDEHGQLLFQVCRLEPKSFRQRRPDGHGGWNWRLNDTRRVLYHLPEVLKGIEAGRTIYLCEGEKDVHAVQATGAIATTNPGGAGKWRPEYTQALRGAEVVIITDRDDVGRRHARDVAAALAGVAESVTLTEPATGKDVADHLAAGHDLTDLVERPHLEVVNNDDQPERGITYIDWRDLFTKPRTPVHWYARPVVAHGRVTLLYSPGKTGKSLIAMEIAAAAAIGAPVLGSEAAEPVSVVYIDQEMTPEDWHDRLVDMGYGPDHIDQLEQHLHLAQLQAWPPMDTPLGGSAVFGEVAKHQAQLVVIDTASKVIKGEENSNDTHAAFYRSTVVPLKRLGCGVLVLDHTGKDVDRGARGGSAKTDNVDLAFELLTRGRDLLSLRCSHARFRDDALSEPVFLRRQSDPLTHQLEEHASKAPEHGPGLRPTHLMEKVSKYVEYNPGLTRNGITGAKLGKTDYVRLALDLLIAEGYVHAESGPNRSQTHRSLKPYREDEE